MSFKVCARRCDQCLFSSAKIVDDQRKAQVLADAARRDAHFVCHKHGVGGHGEDVCCRGFYDANPAATNLMRIAERLGAVEFVEFPGPKPPGAERRANPK